jgi:hypothetical protein
MEAEHFCRTAQISHATTRQVQRAVMFQRMDDDVEVSNKILCVGIWRDILTHRMQVLHMMTKVLGGRDQTRIHRQQGATIGLVFAAHFFVRRLVSEHFKFGTHIHQAVGQAQTRAQ